MTEALTALQALGGVINLAVWVVKFGNAPKEVSRCMELVNLIYKDTQYLIELRNENDSALQQTPRELQRIDEVIISATRSIKDIGVLLEKYRPDAHGGKTTLRRRITWVLADSETFVLRAPNLQIQHATVLGEIGHLKTFALVQPVLKMAGRAEQDRHIENKDLLQSLLGGGNKRASIFSRLETVPAAPTRPLTPNYDVMGNARERSHLDANSHTLHHQPSMTSLFGPPPSYTSSARPASAMDSHPPQGTADASYGGFNPNHHLRNPYAFPVAVPHGRPASVHSMSLSAGPTSPPIPPPYSGLKALLDKTASPRPGSSFMSQGPHQTWPSPPPQAPPNMAAPNSQFFPSRSEVELTSHTSSSSAAPDTASSRSSLCAWSPGGNSFQTPPTSTSDLERCPMPDYFGARASKSSLPTLDQLSSAASAQQAMPAPMPQPSVVYELGDSSVDHHSEMFELDATAGATAGRARPALQGSAGGQGPAGATPNIAVACGVTPLRSTATGSRSLYQERIVELPWYQG